MKHQLTFGPSIDTEECSRAARMGWVIAMARYLQVLDLEVVHGWFMGDFTDRDVLDNIVSHGEIAALCADAQQAPVRLSAQTLLNEASNMLQGLLLSESGNYQLRG